MTRRFLCAVFLGISFACLLCGCHTVKGAAEGAKQDYEEAKKVDGWLQENLW